MLLKILVMFLFVCLKFISLSNAATDEELLFHGFSPDGKYLAFERKGINDVEAETRGSKLIIVDVKKNGWVSSPTKESMKKLGINGTNKGFHVYSRLPTDFSSSKIRFSDGEGSLWNMYGPEISLYELELDQSADECKAINLTLKKVKSFSTLSVTATKGAIDELSTYGTPVSTILQSDKTVPESRGCPFFYRITDVYLFQKRFVAVFIQYFESGYEGSNIRFMVVTSEIQ